MLVVKQGQHLAWQALLWALSTLEEGRCEGLPTGGTLERHLGGGPCLLYTSDAADDWLVV